MTDQNSNGFRLSTAEWKGYVKGSLENIYDDIKEIKKKVDRINQRVTNLQLKMAGIGATVSLIVSLLFLLAKELLQK